MHEIGIASAILDAGEAERACRPGSKLVKIGVRIGVLSGVDVEALRFALSALTANTELAGVTFDLQSCTRQNRCLACGCEFKSGICSGCCPSCSSENVALLGGDELDLAYIELEEA